MNTKMPSYRDFRFPSEIIGHAIWQYHRFCLSFREVEELLAERGSSSPVNPFDNGARGLGLHMPATSNDAKDVWVTCCTSIKRSLGIVNLGQTWLIGRVERTT